jgi:hypothetical protein
MLFLSKKIETILKKSRESPKMLLEEKCQIVELKIDLVFWKKIKTPSPKKKKTFGILLCNLSQM